MLFDKGSYIVGKFSLAVPKVCNFGCPFRHLNFIGWMGAVAEVHFAERQYRQIRISQHNLLNFNVLNRVAVLLEHRRTRAKTCIRPDRLRHHKRSCKLPLNLHISANYPQA